MKDQKNIERLFQEKFKDFEAMPPQDSWSIIASRLNEKKKRRVIPFWFQLSGIAASLIIVGTLIWNFQSTQNSNTFTNSVETIVGVDNENNNSQNSKLNSEGTKKLNSTVNNQISLVEQNTNASENKNTTFDSKLLKSKNSNSTVVSNENQNNYLTTKSKKVNSSIKHGAKKNKNDILYNYNLKKTNSTIVSNSKKEKRNKTAVKNLISNDNIFLSDDNNTNKWVGTKNSKNKTKQNEAISSDKIDLFFDTNQTNTDYVNTNNDTDSKSTDTTNVIVASSENIITNDSTLVVEVLKETNPLEELLKEKEAGKNEDEKEEKRSKWAISTNASPVYFNSLAEGSSIDEQFNSNSKNFTTTLSYGLAGIYSINNKLSIKTGVNNINLSYNTNDVIFNSRMSGAENNVPSISRNADASQIVFSSKNNSVESLSDDVENVLIQNNVGALKQNISYIEVPLELGYKLLDRKFGIEIIGGLSTLFLNNNTVSLVTNGMEMNIGEANNLNNIHFSSNVGLGFKYSFWKSFNANFQPMFKYQINTFSENSGNFKPYFIGLYTGVSFSF